MTDIPENSNVSRRTMIKRGAIATGAMVWATPVIDSFTNVALAGTPADCYSVKYERPEGDGPGTVCLGLDDGTERTFCFTQEQQDILTDTQDPCGTAHEGTVVADVPNDGRSDPWVVTLPAGCSFQFGYSKCGSEGGRPGSTTGESCGEVTSEDIATDENGVQTITFPVCDNGAEISHIEFVYCCS